MYRFMQRGRGVLLSVECCWRCCSPVIFPEQCLMRLGMPQKHSVPFLPSEWQLPESHRERERYALQDAERAERSAHKFMGENEIHWINTTDFFFNDSWDELNSAQLLINSLLFFKQLDHLSLAFQPEIQISFAFCKKKKGHTFFISVFLCTWVNL